jgi:hypothetical protein
LIYGVKSSLTLGWGGFPPNHTARRKVRIWVSAKGIAQLTRAPLDPTVAVAWINLLQKAIWPGVVCFALLVFHSPIANGINSATSGSGATVEIAGLKITLPKSEIPQAPDAIKNILPHLDSDMIANIIANVGGDNKVDTCYPVAEPDELTRDDSVKSRLKHLGLIVFEKEDFTANGRTCAAASKTTYTHTYDLVRQYLIEILSSLKFAN